MIKILNQCLSHVKLRSQDLLYYCALNETNVVQIFAEVTNPYHYSMFAPLISM